MYFDPARIPGIIVAIFFIHLAVNLTGQWLGFWK